MYSSLFLSQSCFMFLKLWFPFLSLNFPYMFLSPFSLFIATHSSPLCFFYYSYLLSFSHSHSLKIIKTFNFHRILTLKLETLNNYLFKKLNEKKPSGYFNFIDIKTLFYYIICDVIKQNQSEVGNIDFKIEPNIAENIFCFLLFLASFNCSYLWNQLTNFNEVFCKR